MRSIGTNLVQFPTAFASSAALPKASVFEADLGCPGLLVDRATRGIEVGAPGSTAERVADPGVRGRGPRR